MSQNTYNSNSIINKTMKQSIKNMIDFSFQIRLFPSYKKSYLIQKILKSSKKVNKNTFLIPLISAGGREPLFVIFVLILRSCRYEKHILGFHWLHSMNVKCI